MKKWTVTLPNGSIQAFEQYTDNRVNIVGSSLYYDMPVFLAGLTKMESVGAKIIVEEV